MGHLDHQVKRFICPPWEAWTSRPHSVRSTLPFAKKGSPFALIADGTSAFPAPDRSVLTRWRN